jgi:hypothetical protein
MLLYMCYVMFISEDNRGARAIIMSDEKLRAKYMLLLDWRAQAAVLGGNVTSLCMICVYLQTSKYSKSPGYCIGHYVSSIYTFD